MNHISGDKNRHPCDCRNETNAVSRSAEILNRRNVLKRAAIGAGTIGLVSVTVACGSSGSNDKSDEVRVSEVTVASGDIPELNGDPYASEEGNFYLVRNEDGVLAFSWSCTHQGCEVPWQEDDREFQCPCHGSVFNLNGERVDGPAERPLDLLTVEVRDNGDVVVLPRATTKRDAYSADQAAPYPV